MIRTPAIAVLLCLGTGTILPVMSAPRLPALLPPQAQILAVAQRAGLDYYPGSWPVDAPDFVVVLEAILLQESSLCTDTHGIDSHAHGCGQMHLSTARLVAGTRISPWMLQHNPILAIRLSASWLAHCFRSTGNWRLAVSAYHRGLPWVYEHGVDEWYVARITRRIEQLPRDAE